MKKTYMAILAAVVAGLSATDAQALDPETWDVPAETWEIHYDHYQSLLSDDPEYQNLSHSVTVKRKIHIFYIKGIFEEYPDAWVIGRVDGSNVTIQGNQELSQSPETPAYMVVGYGQYVAESQNDREYTVGVRINSGTSAIWHFADDGANTDVLLPNTNRSIGIGSKPGESWSLLRTYHFDTTVTGDEFVPLPVYLNPVLRKVGESGIMDSVIEDLQPEDNRVFDMNGRQVNPDRLTPGIYIRAGRKFIVR